MALFLVVLASVLQLLLAATFVIIPVIAYRHGINAQRAAEAEVAGQGFPARVLAQHHLKFEEGAIATLFPFGIALGFAALASLNQAGNEVGRILSLACQSIFLVGGGFVTFGQVFPVRSITSAFDKSGDATLDDINVKAVVDAAQRAFPAGLRPLVIARFGLTTVGSLLVIIFLMTPAVNAYFH